MPKGGVNINEPFFERRVMMRDEKFAVNPKPEKVT
jgi:hypothetical protein